MRAAIIAGVPKPWVISEKFVKFLCIEPSSIWLLLLMILLFLVVVVKLVVAVVVFGLLLVVVVAVAVAGCVLEFILILLLMAVAFNGPICWPQIGDLSRFRTSINSSSI